MIFVFTIRSSFAASSCLEILAAIGSLLPTVVADKVTPCTHTLSLQLLALYMLYCTSLHLYLERHNKQLIAIIPHSVHTYQQHKVFDILNTAVVANSVLVVRVDVRLQRQWWHCLQHHRCPVPAFAGTGLSIRNKCKLCSIGTCCMSH